MNSGIRSYTFHTLREVPLEKVFRACRESADGSIQTGDLIWRTAGVHGHNDGLNFVGKDRQILKEDCDAALKGALFQEYGAVDGCSGAEMSAFCSKKGIRYAE